MRYQLSPPRGADHHATPILRHSNWASRSGPGHHLRLELSGDLRARCPDSKDLLQSHTGKCLLAILASKADLLQDTNASRIRMIGFKHLLLTAALVTYLR